MIIHNIKITNFKSIYGTQYFEFDKCKGLVKLSGAIGSGKTTIGEAILYGLFGAVKGQNKEQLIAWNTKACEVEVNLTSKGREIHILRNIYAPLIVDINGKRLSAANKKDTQNILEEELFDVPKLAVIKMYIISFSAFNSLAAMNPAETKQFLNDIFGFKIFDDYNVEIINERKLQLSENTKYQALYSENLNQIEYLKNKRNTQQQELTNTIDIDNLNSKRQELINKGIDAKNKKNNIVSERDQKINDINNNILEIQKHITETITLGKQEKNYYNTFKSGICPTCGQSINAEHLEEHKNKMNEYVAKYKELEKIKNKYEDNIRSTRLEYQPKIDEYDNMMSEYKSEISDIDLKIKMYNKSLELINDNFDDLISECEKKSKMLKEKLDTSDIEILEWNEMNDLFTKTLRYNLLETLIPHINNSIQFFINKLDQSYKIQYDEEFKPHIFVDSFDREISYNNLSTGQRKSLDLAIVFGILKNIISNVECNILFLDELFSNMDVNARNIMLELLKENISDNKTVFVINHAEMNDDYFDHKIRVKLDNIKINSEIVKTKDEVLVKASKYEQIF